MGAFVLFDVVSPWAADYAGAEIVLPAIFGAAAAQFGLIVILAALGDEYWPLRQLQALVLAVSSVWCLWDGFRLTNLLNIALPEAASAAAFMPLALLSAQAPLWAVRLTRGWTIERPVNSSPAAKRAWRQFTILDLLMVTAMAAFALVSSQFGLWLIAEAYPVGELVILLVAIIVGCALTTLPCVWSALGVRQSDIGCVAILLYVSACSLLTFGISSAIQGGNAPRVVLVATAILGAWTLGLMHLVLLALRAAGYRLHSQRRAGGRDV
jgi:hypothetical protein